MIFLTFKVRQGNAGGLAGIDANGNGIRDDIEEFVKKYPDEGVRRAAIQVHQSIQAAIMDPDHWNTDEADLAYDCLASRVANVEERGKITEEMEAATANTAERVSAYWKANENQSGRIMRGTHPDPKACR